MDSITLLSTSVMGVLMFLAKKGAGEFAGEAGKATFDKARNLLATLKARWTGDKEATANLSRFEENPERYRPLLEDILKEKLYKDRDLADELTQILREMGPTLEVIQKMKEAKQVTGLQVKEMTGGRAKVKQEIEKGEDVTGVKINRLGRNRNGKKSSKS